MLFLSAGVVWLYFHNFRVVIPDLVYRSTQLTAQDFRQVIETRHIKSILNLRGANQGEPWYDEELAVSQQMGVIHQDIALNSKELPPKKIITVLINQIRNLPKPLLIHCESGVDRSGFAADIALLLFTHSTLDDLEAQVSWRYFVFSKQSIGKQFLTSYNAF